MCVCLCVCVRACMCVSFGTSMYWRGGQGGEDGLACKIGTQFSHICNKKHVQNGSNAEAKSLIFFLLLVLH